MKDITKITDTELIHILETPEDYIPKLFKLAKIEIKNRGISNENIKIIAEEICIAKINKTLQNSLYKFDFFELPKSYFLNENEIMEIFDTQFNIFKSNRSIFNSNLPMG